MGLRKISDPFCAHRDIQREVSSVVIAPTLHGNPSVIQDMHGRILAWYLPDVLTERRQVYPIWTLFHVCCWLTGHRLGTNEKCITAPKPSPPTQPKHEYLAEQARGIQRSEGVSVVYSGVCWPKSGLVRSGPQGRSDVVVIVEMTLIRIVRHQSPRFKPHISASLRQREHRLGNGHHGNIGIDKRHLVRLPSRIILCRPSMHGMSSKGWRLFGILGIWAPCLTEFPLSPTERQFFIAMGNHVSHGMTSSAPLGGDENTVLEFRDLGIRLHYTSRTVVAHSGRLLYHGISVAENERVCYAYWMRDCIHEAMGVISYMDDSTIQHMSVIHGRYYSHRFMYTVSHPVSVTYALIFGNRYAMI